MIASLQGRVQEVEAESLIVEIGGVGYLLNVPAPTRDRLHPGDVAFLHTQLIVRQDSLTLYGFETKEEREFFNLLLGVNGIGPRLAIGILSVLSPDAIRRAVVNEQADVFSRVPGIGKKTAQKIFLQLQDRVRLEPGLETISRMSDVDSEVLGALTGLGYSVVEAQAALQSIPRDASQDIEVRLRLALQYFA